MRCSSKGSVTTTGWGAGAGTDSSGRRAVEPAPPPVPAPQPVVVADPLLEQRVAALEARAEEQEAMLRRVLILLVDWVENSQEPAYHRTHAA